LPPEEVHFHEVGAVDSIVDIVGACIALELLGKPRVLAAPVIEGVGWVNCAHGRLPVPAPATLAILGARGVGDHPMRRTARTGHPTGAALLAEFVESFEPMTRPGGGEDRLRPRHARQQNPPECAAGGAGEAPANPPSAIRHPHMDWDTDTVAVLETNLDDCTGEVLGHFMEKGDGGGRVGRVPHPGSDEEEPARGAAHVLCIEADADRFSEMILRETTAFGVRRRLAERRKLKRKVKTRFGEVQVKVGLLDGKPVQVAPEYESCRALAAEARVPVRQVFDAALRAARTRG
jgi:pyridinium-3,5-bisthiocarboxylic acid mononucleotide nickel chelatase